LRGSGAAPPCSPTAWRPFQRIVVSQICSRSTGTPLVERGFEASQPISNRRAILDVSAVSRPADPPLRRIAEEGGCMGSAMARTTESVSSLGESHAGEMPCAARAGNGGDTGSGTPPEPICLAPARVRREGEDYTLAGGSAPYGVGEGYDRCASDTATTPPSGSRNPFRGHRPTPPCKRCSSEF
jgi:hypothetical protein